MNDQLPAPLVPSNVDLRGLPYMPLDVNRLRDSYLSISATGEEFRAAVLLWCASWNQVPAASLPDDDTALAAYAGFGRDLKGWKKARKGALHNFVKCSDDRLYHRVVAEKALEAWEERKDYRDKRENEAARLKHHREEHKALRDELRGYGITAPWNEKIESLRAMVLNAQQQRTNTETETRTGALPATANKGREEKGREGITKNQEQSSLRSDSSTAAPPTGQGDAQQTEAEKQRKQEVKAARLAGVTMDAMQVYNGLLAKPNGALPKVSDVNIAKKRRWVERCIQVASEICQRQYGSKLITLQFWQDFFNACDGDDFMAGRSRNGAGHENWKPDFEYLTRPDVMTKVFERVTSEEDVPA